MTLSLQEILLRIRAGGPGRRVAEGELLQWIRRSALRQRLEPFFFDESVSHAMYVVRRKALAETLDSVESWDAYLATVLRNKQHDLRRSERREQEGRRALADHLAVFAAATTEDLDRQRRLEDALEGHGEQAQALLRRVWARAVADAKESARAGLDAVFEQVLSIVFKGATLRGLLSASPALANDRAALGRAEGAAHKAHERVRTRLREALDDLARSGALQPAELALARRSLSLLRRTPAGPPEPGGRHDEGGVP